MNVLVIYLRKSSKLELLQQQLPKNFKKSIGVNETIGNAMIKKFQEYEKKRIQKYGKGANTYQWVIVGAKFL